MKKHYDILGLKEGASKEDIENKYNRLSDEFDPNNNDNQDFFKEEFKKIQDAYNALTNNSILTNSDTYNNELEITEEKKVEDSIKEEVDESDFNISEKQKMFSAPFSFDGRIRRTEYGISFIIFIFSSAFLNVLAIQVPILGFACIPLYWFYWAQGAKRCHDRDNSGWFQIIPFYPFWMIFAESQEGMNRFGPNPKGIN
jgi:uncharacterized membrane protein YhaH (DUF805 family)